MKVRYTWPARLLHWLMAGIIITAWGIGFYADRILPVGPSYNRAGLLAFHKEIATCIIILFVLRLAWRATHRPPEVEGALTEDQRFVVHVAHWALYGLMILTPLTGWIMSSAHGYPVPMLWLVHLPPLVHKSPVLAPFFTSLHQLSSWVLGVFIAGHITAALLHRFSRRDGIMDTML
ncbi:cytochrome b [Neokomagataea tanensis]|uniref:Cytochrome b n=1 Tax=Neokomagataea tanensis TaxID=661191 RepID=A0A4Y6V9G5_9PROT|nr:MULTISPECIES: cytochrome b/b6 domain-containing protein [Neokomagataea]QDH25107.1 cytochrome b [Neokomagataea tanensis]